jgi:K+-transporting ATPase A subunit
MARVFEGQRSFMHPFLRWLEGLTYKVVGVKEEVEQHWTTLHGGALELQHLRIPADLF